MTLTSHESKITHPRLKMDPQLTWWAYRLLYSEAPSLYCCCSPNTKSSGLTGCTVCAAELAEEETESDPLVEPEVPLLGCELEADE